MTFNGIIVNNLGFTAVQTSLLNMPTGIMSTLSAFIFSWVAAKWTNHRCLVTMIAASIPAIGVCPTEDEYWRSDGWNLSSVW